MCKIARLGKNVTAFVCGGKQDHNCNNKGPVIYQFSDGFTGTIEEKCKAENINPNICEMDKLYFLEKRQITTIGISVSCSICGRSAIDNALWSEI